MSVNKKSGIILNIIISIVSFIITFFVLEILLFPVFLTCIPLRLHGYLPEHIIPLTQKSKRHIKLRNYAALVGDSFTVGLGDDFIKDSPNQYLSEMLGRDVLSFGQADSGSFESIIEKFIFNYNRLQCSYLYKIAAPAVILVCFYEGNDLNNNLEEWENRVLRSPLFQDKSFPYFIAQSAENDINEYYRQTGHYFPFGCFVMNMICSFTKGKEWFEKNYFSDSEIDFSKRNITKAVVGEDIIFLPDELQSPALELTSKEIATALYVFEESLKYVTGCFSPESIYVVYIPSPLSSYRLRSEKVSIQCYKDNGVSIYDAQLVEIYSTKISKKVHEITRKLNCGFIDTRPFIRAAANNKLIHVKSDWKHFTTEGYKVLFSAISSYLKDGDSIK